jgi:hypothetical protein
MFQAGCELRARSVAPDRGDKPKQLIDAIGRVLGDARPVYDLLTQ